MTLALVAAVFALMLVAGAARPFDMRNLVNETRTVEALLNTLLGGIVLLVSVVVSVNSIMLTGELTSLGEHYRRVEGSMQFDRATVDVLPDEGPLDPPRFVGSLLGAIADQVEALATISAASDDRRARTLERYVEDTTTRVARVLDRVDDTPSGDALDALMVGLTYDATEELALVRRLRSDLDEELTAADRARFEELVDTLLVFAAGREYFKTVYLRQELADLSRTLLYTSLPAILLVSYAVLALDARMFPDVTLFGLGPLAVYVLATYTVALTPFVVLTAHVLRTATVARRTLSTGSFTLREVALPDGEPGEQPEE